MLTKGFSTVNMKSRVRSQSSSSSSLFGTTRLFSRNSRHAAAAVSSSRRVRAVVLSKLGLLYSSSSGSTTAVAEFIKAEMGDLVTDPTDPEEVDDLKAFLADCEGFIMGSPTWNTSALTGRSGLGMDQVCEQLRAGELSDVVGNKKAAVFGCGDGFLYGDNFSEMVDEVYHALKGAGAEMVGHWEYTTDDSDDENPRYYDGFTESKAIVGSGGSSPDGQSQGSAEEGSALYGLVCDQENHSEMSEQRVKVWCEQLKAEMA
ncbi:hypothetical protein CYMTET_47908 [Cymbomonas tetramitiformis]|uniref:Flavodoxin-like domain-containing protein n=1 Tax=Cymbomonas tetramitiformis TaxID=36881 RepID=A0AAE0EX96_9CHLO|nr:hypothetical protein CYMTET_47908 [Cymbomonas tetramitiformis]